MKTRTALLLALLLSAAACGSADGTTASSDPAPPTTGEPGADVFGDTEWQLVAATVDGRSLVLMGDHPVTLAVGPDGTLGGVAACNRYGGPFTLEGATLTVGALAMTEMACFPEEVQQLETDYLTALARVAGAAVDGEELVLTGDGVELRYSAQPAEAAAPLAGTVWVLETLISGESASSTVAEATLTIDDAGTVSGSTGCNSLGGTVTVTGDSLDTSGLIVTDIACDPALAGQEASVLAVLGANPSWRIDGPSLNLSTPDGAGLHYRATTG